MCLDTEYMSWRYLRRISDASDKQDIMRDSNHAQIVHNKYKIE